MRSHAAELCGDKGRIYMDLRENGQQGCDRRGLSFYPRREVLVIDGGRCSATVMDALVDAGGRSCSCNEAARVVMKQAENCQFAHYPLGRVVIDMPELFGIFKGFGSANSRFGGGGLRVEEML